MIPLFCFSLQYGCGSLQSKKAKLILQEKNLVSFEIEESSIPLIFSNVSYKPKLTGCKSTTNKDLEYLFRSLRDANPSLLSSKEKAVFPTGLNLVSFNDKILTAIENAEKSPEFLFFIWKEDDPLNPYTRIRRTTFYFFCESNKINIIFGEWKRDIVFQNQFTWSEWISASRFNYEYTDKQKLIILNEFQDKVQFFAQREKDSTRVFNNWVRFYKDKIPSINQIPKVIEKVENKEIKNRNNNLIDRLQTLEELKKKGLINENEYQEKRKELLDTL